MYLTDAYKRAHPEQTQPKCYDKTYHPDQWRHKTTEELVGWAKNIKAHFLVPMLEEDPFPAELFETLQTRYEGIMADVEARRAHETGKTTAQLRKDAERWLLLSDERESRESGTFVSTEQTDLPRSELPSASSIATKNGAGSIPTGQEACSPPKKRKLGLIALTPTIQGIRNELAEEQERRKKV